ncbi:hypothetical protein ACFQ4Y_14695 [Kroppenstedtia sanguinis]|uniref:Uncharacterized protein n=1 Tax=Kroppenstedtia sanguinis TaxID=1380684 RepID=A0ABW4CDX4_9BACL
MPYGCKATFALWALQFEIKDAPQALQSKGAEALDEGSHPTNLKGGAFRGNLFPVLLPQGFDLPDGQIWSGPFSLPCRMATVAWVNTISPPKIWLINTLDPSQKTSLISYGRDFN